MRSSRVFNTVMKRRIPLLLAASVLGITLVGVGVARQTLSSFDWTRGLLRNPFQLSTRTGATGPVVLEQVQRLQRLETCRYNGQVIVRGDTKGMLPTWLAGDRLLFVGRGEVVAGVDLSRLKPEDVAVEQDTVAVRLPSAEILHSRLDNHGSEVFERRSGIFTGPDRTLEGRVRVEAEDRIRQAALESGVLATANTNARDTLRGHLQLLGFRNVRFM